MPFPGYPSGMPLEAMSQNSYLSPAGVLPHATAYNPTRPTYGLPASAYPDPMSAYASQYQVGDTEWRSLHSV